MHKEKPANAPKPVEAIGFGNEELSTEEKLIITHNRQQTKMSTKRMNRACQTRSIYIGRLKISLMMARAGLRIDI